MKRTAQTERPQKAIGGRGAGPRLVALAVVLGAVAMIVYAAGFHFLPVLVEQKIDVSVFAPPEILPPGPTGPGLAPPGGGPGTLPDMVELVPVEESEPELVHEVTFGGVARTPSGEIKRTYSGKPPSACPT